ncbi:MAG TPA: hypothetical protein PK405_02080 [Hyphomicrobiales bacterium]|nr:hypothetical protein [Rhodobiaceae bacterium]HXK53450.1 hypothetical protein [Hyphomicrobiales bacterium]
MNEPSNERQPGDNSPEYVAMKMAEIILIYIENGSWNRITREDYLDTYIECLEAVRGKRMALPRAPGNGAFDFETAQF